MELKYFEGSNKEKALLTLGSISEVIDNLIDWNKDITSTDDYYSSPGGMQLLAANCTLITALGEGVNRINRAMPDFLSLNFPDIPWRDIVGMRNRIAHAYFELDAEMVLYAIRMELFPLKEAIIKAIDILKSDYPQNE